MHITVDAHIDLPWMMQKKGVFDLSKNNHGETSAVDFPRMKEGGLQAAVFALYLSDQMQDSLGDYESVEAIWSQILWLHNQHGCEIVFPDRHARTAHEILQSGKVPIFLGLEGGRLIHENLNQLYIFHIAGVKYLTLTHNRNTDWADSATDVRYHCGLTRFGEDVIKEANKLGVLVDVSHSSDETCWAALGNSFRPVIASHSGCRALLNHPRNLSDGLIKAIAKTGGVIHIPFARRFVGASMSSVAEHIDHVAQLVGNAHVGIGSDLDGAATVDGAESVSAWRFVVHEELDKRGYSDAGIQQIAGGNTLRILT